MPAIGELSIAYDHVGNLCIGTVIDAPAQYCGVGQATVYYIKIQDAKSTNWGVACVLVEGDEVLAIGPNIRACATIAAGSLARRQHA